MVAREKYRNIVQQIALDNYGYVTTLDAVQAGVPSGELAKLAHRGGLEHISYGLYRVTDIPVHQLDQFAEALFRVGEDAYLHGESVLALFELADVNPRRIFVATPKRRRPTLPEHIDLTPMRSADTTLYEGLNCQRVAEALLECRGRIDSARLTAATAAARKGGLLTTSEWKALQKELAAS